MIVSVVLLEQLLEKLAEKILLDFSRKRIDQKLQMIPRLKALSLSSEVVYCEVDFLINFWLFFSNKKLLSIAPSGIVVSNIIQQISSQLKSSLGDLFLFDQIPEDCKGFFDQLFLIVNYLYLLGIKHWEILIKDLIIPKTPQKLFELLINLLHL